MFDFPTPCKCEVPPNCRIVYDLICEPFPVTCLWIYVQWLWRPHQQPDVGAPPWLSVLQPSCPEYLLEQLWGWSSPCDSGVCQWREDPCWSRYRYSSSRWGAAHTLLASINETKNQFMDLFILGGFLSLSIVKDPLILIHKILIYKKMK